jgi:tripartite-type tricarboxylate transporter receptor subunit TctC
MQRLAPTLCSLLLLLALAPVQAADAFPARPVKLVVAFAPGGNNDVPVRIVAARLAELWSVPVVVDNRPGGGGIVGTASVARAPADGYTLLNCNSATHGVNPALHKQLAYDVVRDFTAVSLIGSAPNVLVVPAASALRSLQDVVAQGKASPGTLAVGTAGIGSTQHFSLELMKSMAGVDIVHLPYKGGAPALADLLGGQIPAAITGLPTALQSIKAGKVRALAITSTERSRLLPEVPTFAEAGLPGYEVSTWTGLCAPAGTPRNVVDKLNDDIRKALAVPETHQQLLDAGVEPVSSPAEAFAQRIAAEVAKFTRIAIAANISAEP